MSERRVESKPAGRTARPEEGPWRAVLLASLGVALLAGCGSDADRLARIEERLSRIESQLEKLVETRKDTPAPRGGGAPPPEPSHPASSDVPARAPRPAIAVEQPIHDFGVAWAPARLSHDFTVRNRGEAELVISRVKPACGCTVAGPYPERLAPGEAGTFSFTLDTRNLRGRYSKKIEVFSNDPDTPKIELALRGESRHHVDVDPPNALFGRVYGDEVKTRVVKITTNTGKELQLQLDEERRDDSFSVKLKETRPGREYELHIATVPPYETGTLRRTIRLQTNIDAQRTVEIPVFATVPDRLEVYPKVLLLRPRRGTQGYAGVVRLKHYGEEPVALLDAVADDPALEVTVNEVAPGKTYTIMVEASDVSSVPPQGRTLTLVTDDAETPVLDVSVRTSARGIAAGPRAQPQRPALTLVGRSVPPLSLTTDKGATVSSDDFGRAPATVLNLVAPNCGFCKRQIPVVEKVRAEFEARGVRFVNVAQTMGRVYTGDEVRKAMDALGSHLELAHDPKNAVGALLKTSGYPTMFVIGRDGKVRHVNIGAQAGLEETLKKQLRGLLESGNPSTS